MNTVALTMCVYVFFFLTILILLTRCVCLNVVIYVCVSLLNYWFYLYNNVGLFCYIFTNIKTGCMYWAGSKTIFSPNFDCMRCIKNKIQICFWSSENFKFWVYICVEIKIWPCNTVCHKTIIVFFIFFFLIYQT